MENVCYPSLFCGSRSCVNGWDFDFAEQGAFQSKGNSEGLGKSILAVSLGWPTSIPSLDATVSSSYGFNSFFSHSIHFPHKEQNALLNTQFKSRQSFPSLLFTGGRYSTRSYLPWPLPASLASSLMPLLTRFLCPLVSVPRNYTGLKALVLEVPSA